MVHILGCNNLNVVARTAWSTDKVQAQCIIVFGGFHSVPVMLCSPHYINIQIVSKRRHSCNEVVHGAQSGL
jgi:hypothetical protein